MVSGSWLTTLQQDLLHTQRQAFAKGSLKNLKSQWKKFLGFSVNRGVLHLPVSLQDLCLYIQFLTRSLKCPKSIRNYVSGLKTLHLLLDIPFPSYTELQLKLTFRGVDRSLCHVPHQAEPITTAILSQIHQVLNFSLPLHVVIWCLFLFSFFLFARRSQFVPDSTSPSHTSNLVSRQDISVQGDLVLVTFNWTKTHQTGGKPLVVPLAKIPGSILCPVTAFSHMVQLIPAPPLTPAFVVPFSGSFRPITYHFYQTIIRSCVSALGLEPSKFSSHSFRRGGASFAFSIGIPGELIQSQGDWKSEAYKLYLNLDENQRLVVARRMASHIMNKV